MTTGMELMELLDQIIKKGKATGRKPGDTIEELPTDEEKKRQLRQVLQLIIEGPQAGQQIQWQY